MPMVDDRLGDGVVEEVLTADHVVGGERADDHAGLAALEDRGGEADRGGGVARLALEDDVEVLEALQLALDGGAVRATGNDHDAVGARDRREPVPGDAEQGLARAGQVVQELRGVRPRERPQPRADPACRDHAVEAVERGAAIGLR
jgi:hypothetical protein